MIRNRTGGREMITQKASQSKDEGLPVAGKTQCPRQEKWLRKTDQGEKEGNGSLEFCSTEGNQGMPSNLLEPMRTGRQNVSRQAVCGESQGRVGKKESH